MSAEAAATEPDRRAVERPRSDPSYLLLNNYPLTGIGDFGSELGRTFAAAGIPLAYEETRPDGRKETAQLARALRWPGTLLANVGLTAWGASGPRNFAGFAALGARIRLGRPTIAFVHNPIEVIEVATAGYRIDSLVGRGAHFATALLRGSRLVVFSPSVEEVLRSHYRLRADLVTPIPCPRAIPAATDEPAQPPVVVALGYLSPYKGHAALPGIRARVRAPAHFVVVGGPHRVLMQDPAYRAAHEALLRELRAADIDPLGRIDDPELDRLLARTAVGLMPYASTQGGSSTFSRFASAGVPVVAPRLPLFEWLASIGAGVWPVDPGPDGVADGVERLLTDRTLHRTLAERQRSFAESHDWPAFLRSLRQLA
jgi:glycosyltransferase involved in cell wall biosynthesis